MDKCRPICRKTDQGNTLMPSSSCLGQGVAWTCRATECVCMWLRWYRVLVSITWYALLPYWEGLGFESWTKQVMTMLNELPSEDLTLITFSVFFAGGFIKIHNASRKGWNQIWLWIVHVQITSLSFILCKFYLQKVSERHMHVQWSLALVMTSENSKNSVDYNEWSLTVVQVILSWNWSFPSKVC